MDDCCQSVECCRCWCFVGLTEYVWSLWCISWGLVSSSWSVAMLLVRSRAVAVVPQTSIVLLEMMATKRLSEWPVCFRAPDS